MYTTVKDGLVRRDWGKIWLIPSLGVFAALAVFLFAF